jgi:pimeloyl-ACP methyl ester carboxylesterase
MFYYLRKARFLLNMQEQKEIYINKLRTNYKIAGKGKPIVILHGWGGSSDSWEQVSKILALTGYKVISPDFPGFGKSLTPLKIWNLTNYMDWLENFLDFLKLKKVSIISHSFGGRVAVKFAAKYPNRIEKLILCSPAGVRIKPNLSTRTTLYANAAGGFIFNKKALNLFKGSLKSWSYFFLRNTDYVKASKAMREIMKKVLEEDLTQKLSEIKSKTLIIWGAKDKLIPLKYAYVFKGYIKNSKLKVLPKIGHSPHLENPEKLLEVIFKFLC